MEAKKRPMKFQIPGQKPRAPGNREPAFKPGRIIPPLLVVLCVLALILDYASRQRETIVEYAEYNAAQLTEMVATEIAATVGYAESSIRGIAVSIGAGMTGPELKDPRTVISPLTENTPFGAIEYIRADGMNIMNPGEPFDASDRTYYTEGIRGNTGIWNNHHPKVSKETLVNFYTPLYYGGEIAGVLTGYLESRRQISPLLRMEFFGAETIGFLYEKNGMLICSSREDVPFVPDLTVDKMIEGYGFNEAQEKAFREILNGETNGSVSYRGAHGEGRISVSAVPGTDWYAALVIPASSFETVVGASTRNAAVLIVTSCAVLGVYVAYLMYRSAVERRRMARENEKLEEENRRFDEENRRAFEELRRANADLEENRVQLEKARDEANVANRAKSTFLFSMSHDIRTPMNAILGYTGLMEKELGDPEKLADHLAKIRTSADYLLALINNVLEVSRIDSGKIAVEEKPVDLMDPECSVVPLLENEIARRNQKFEGTMDITHRYVYADMQKIREVMMNLMSNAIKYTPAGGSIRMDFREIECEREGYARYVNSIIDTGIGMSPEFVGRIFDDFAREHDTTESKVVGTGLGMAIVKRLCDIMDARIEIDSERGKGTTIRVIMEHRIAEEADVAANRKVPATEQAADIAGVRILLAEDNELNTEIACAILSDAGAEVEHAADGAICVEMLRERPAGYYDAILMDIQMPVMNGYAATEEIRRMEDPEKASIPIIAMTANAFDEDRKNAEKAGMNAYVAKPIRVPELKEVLSRFTK
ncbi:MAG: response regulator [Clostridia bacterium]|nr:response regulator [Clostridia bacterium]